MELLQALNELTHVKLLNSAGHSESAMLVLAIVIADT